MNTTSYTITSETVNILSMLGGQIKKARLRRSLSVVTVAEKVGISRTTLWNVEKGSPSVAIGIYAAVLHILDGMDRDLLCVAQDDIVGRELQDSKLLNRKRIPKKGE